MRDLNQEEAPPAVALAIMLSAIGVALSVVGRENKGMASALDRLTEKAAVLNEVRLDKNYPLRGPAVHWDNTIMGLCNELLAAAPKDRELFSGMLTKRQRDALGRYGHRATMLALREGSEQRLRTGLLAAAFADSAELDERDMMIGLALHHHVAKRLGFEPATVFEEIAAVAPAHTADLLRTFGARTDVTLEAFGWSERSTPEGPEFRFS